MSLGGMQLLRQAVSPYMCKFGGPSSFLFFVPFGMVNFVVPEIARGGLLTDNGCSGL